MKILIVVFFTLVLFAACSSKPADNNGELVIDDSKLVVIERPDIGFDAYVEPSDEPVEPIPEPPDYIEIAKANLSEEHGRVYVGMSDLMNHNYRHIDTGIVHPASTIKAMIMEYALLQIHAGNASLDEIYDGYTLLYSIEQMVQVSCNESTGTLVARFGRANIQSWLDVNYPDTELNSDWRNYHHNNKYNEITVEDTILFLERLWANRYTQPYDRMLDIMFGTTWSREKIPAATEGIAGVMVASKSGSYVDGSDTADHDMAIVVKYGLNGEIEFAYALTFYSFSNYSEISYSAARPAIIAMSLDIYEQVAEFMSAN
jgi:hypothetical protein